MAENKKGRIVWLFGYSGAGKTFLSDYLATVGWHEIDGDYFSQSKDPEDIKIWDNMLIAMKDYWMKGESPPMELWAPHHKILCEKAIEKANEGQDVAVGFAIYKIVARDYVRSLMPDDFRFIHVDVNKETLVERHLKRTQRMMSEQGITLETMWAMEGHGMPEVREKYGQEYSDDRYRAMVRDLVCGGFEGIYDGEKNVDKVDNDKANMEGVEQIQKILGIENKGPVDLEAIAAVNFARLAKNTALQEIKQKEAAKKAEEAAKAE